MAARPDARARGFVLPTTILVMTLLTVMLAAAFSLVSAEFRTTDNAFAMRRAYAVAQAGLSEYLIMNRLISGSTTYDSVRITAADGYADVVARRLVDSTTAMPALWVVRSVGTITTAGLTGTPQASRTVGTLAYLNGGYLPSPAAFVAANPIVLTGSGPNPLRGQDGCTAANRRSLLVAHGDYTNGVSGEPLPPDGIDSLATRQAVLDSTHIDWAALVNGNFTPDYVVPAWPVWSGYPVGYAPGDVTIGNGGRAGILVVRGNLTLAGAGSSQWNGIILVGGSVKVTAQAQVSGMIISGLNNLITPNSVGADTILRSASPVFQWHSCYFSAALAGLSALAPLSKHWIDTWSTY